MLPWESAMRRFTQESDSAGMHKNKAKGCGNMENLQNDIAIIDREAL